MKQKGFTLIELITALGVGSVILAAIVGVFFMVVFGAGDIRSKTTTLTDIESAAHYLNRDVIMGQVIDLQDGAEPVNEMTLTWMDFTGGVGNEVSHYVIYTHSGTELLREYDSADNTTIVGRHLTDVGFSIVDNMLTVTLTSSTEGTRPSTVTRTWEIHMDTKEEDIQ